MADILSGHPGIVFSYVYGSFVECEQFRDIDVAVYLEDNYLDSRKNFDIEFQLSEDLSVSVGYPIDVRILNNAPLGFQYHVTRGLVLMTRDEILRADFVERTWLRYLDFKLTADGYLREMFV